MLRKFACICVVLSAFVLFFSCNTDNGRPVISVTTPTAVIYNDETNFDFGNIVVGSHSQSVTFTIHNNGNKTLKLTDENDIVKLDSGNTNMFTVIDFTTQTQLKSLVSTTFSISFSPVSSGVKTAKVLIENNDPIARKFTFTISGKGVTPEIAVTQNSVDFISGTTEYDFGKVALNNSQKSAIFIIENNGNSDLVLTNSSLPIAISGLNSSEFIINQSLTATTIKPGASTNFTITFDPIYTGHKSAVVSIKSNDPDENPFILKLIGKGENPDIPIGWIGGGNDGWQIGLAPSSGDNLSQFNSPRSVAIDSLGNLYVADTENNRIVKWDAQGKAVGWIGGGQDGWQIGPAPSKGSNYKSFYAPQSICIDNNDNIYVSDRGNYRICKWDKDGKAVGWIGGGKDGWQIGSAPSFADTDYRSFDCPHGIAIDLAGNIFVADWGNNRICKWDRYAYCLGWIGGGHVGWNKGSYYALSSTDYDYFNGPYSVYLDSLEYIYVADHGNHRISKWSSTGNPVGWIGDGKSGWNVSIGASSADDCQSFCNPVGVFINDIGEIYIADHGNHRICKWDYNGNAIGWIGGGNVGWQNTNGNGLGTDLNSFHYPFGIFGDTKGYLYISDTYNHRVCKWQD